MSLGGLSLFSMDSKPTPSPAVLKARKKYKINNIADFTYPNPLIKKSTSISILKKHLRSKSNTNTRVNLGFPSSLFLPQIGSSISRARLSLFGKYDNNVSAIKKFSRYLKYLKYLHLYGHITKNLSYIKEISTLINLQSLVLMTEIPSISSYPKSLLYLTSLKKFALGIRDRQHNRSNDNQKLDDCLSIFLKGAFVGKDIQELDFSFTSDYANFDFSKTILYHLGQLQIPKFHLHLQVPQGGATINNCEDLLKQTESISFYSEWTYSKSLNDFFDKETIRRAPKEIIFTKGTLYLFKGIEDKLRECKSLKNLTLEIAALEDFPKDFGEIDRLDSLKLIFSQCTEDSIQQELEKIQDTLSKISSIETLILRDISFSSQLIESSIKLFQLPCFDNLKGFELYFSESDPLTHNEAILKTLPSLQWFPFLESLKISIKQMHEENLLWSLLNNVQNLRSLNFRLSSSDEEFKWSLPLKKISALQNIEKLYIIFPYQGYSSFQFPGLPKLPKLRWVVIEPERYGMRFY